MSAGITYHHSLESAWESVSRSIKHQMESRGYRAANELRNASQLVLRGQRHGRRYIVPGTGRVTYYRRNTGKHKAGTATITYKHYTASAPGEPPAVRLGHFRLSWHPKTFVESPNGEYSVVSQVESTLKTEKGNHLLGEILEYGTDRMAPRPHQERIQEKALPAIKRIYNEPYE